MFFLFFLKLINLSCLFSGLSSIWNKCWIGFATWKIHFYRSYCLLYTTSSGYCMRMNGLFLHQNRSKHIFTLPKLYKHGKTLQFSFYLLKFFFLAPILFWLICFFPFLSAPFYFHFVFVFYFAKIIIIRINFNDL